MTQPDNPSNVPDIIYEDNHILVAVKKPGVLSQSTGDNTPDMLTLLKAYIQKRYEKPGKVFLGLVHRLDQPVGGIMVFARTSKAASRLSEQIRNRQLERYYLAVVEGSLTPARAILSDYLEKQPSGHVAVQSDGTGKHALLAYQTLQIASDESKTLVCVRLGTGRPHQIRVQFASRHHPIIGDRRYGPRLYVQSANVPALYACGLTLIHPTRKEQLTFFSQPLKILPWSQFSLPDASTFQVVIQSLLNQDLCV